MALDPSLTCTGVAIAPQDWDGDVRRVTLRSFNGQKVERGAPEEEYIVRAGKMAEHIYSFACEHDVKAVYIEDYAWSKQGAQRLGELVGEVKRQLWDWSYRHIHVVNMGSARKTLTGNGHARKADCRKALEAHGFRFKNYDESDAMVILNHVMSEEGGYCLVG